VTIGTECPHCESVFQVAAELAGKAMRCPNPTCREVFSVPTTSPPAEPAPTPVRSASVDDYLPVVEADRIDPPAMQVYDAEPVVQPVPKAKPIPPAAPRPTAAALPPLPSGPKVVDWNEAEDDLPGGKVQLPNRTRTRSDEDSDLPIRTRRSAGGLSGKVILIGLVLLLFAAVGGTVAFFALGKFKSEEQDAVAAEEMYKEGKFGEAKRRYDALAADFPDSNAVPKYQFFSALSQTQIDASSVTVKDDPTPARESLTKLVNDHRESPYAQPDKYGSDVLVVGKKVCDAIAGHANEQVKKFQAKRTEVNLLDAADTAIVDGRTLLPTLEKFRDKSGVNLDEQKANFDTAEAGVQKERSRLATLAPWRDLSNDPTDLRIDQFEKAMKAAVLDKDGEVQAMAAAAKTSLRAKVRYRAEPRAAENAPVDVDVALTIAPRVAGSPDIKQLAGKQDAVFGIAHGVLYALDVRNGAKLWAERLSSDGRAGDAPLRVSLAGGAADWVIVPSTRGGIPALTARASLTGEVAWHLPLPAPVLGQPALVGDRLIVALADPLGTLLQLNVTDGTQLGKVELRQPIGGGIAAMKGTSSGHGFLVVPADARRVFVFEVGKLGEDGSRQPPQVVRVFATNHPRDSLRGPPLLVAGDDPALPRRVILAQSDGPQEMKLRSFPIPSATDLMTPSSDGDTRPEQMAEATVGGWSWFPPITDGERVAVCTDKGVFAAFGLNLPGQADKPLYQLPGQLADPDPAAVSRCQVVAMDDDAFWVIVNSKLTRLRVSSDAKTGVRILPSQESRLVGEPVAAPYVRQADGLAVVTTKATDAGTIHLQAFDLNTGEEKWRRQLGAVAVHAPVALHGGGRLVVDECGGVYRLAVDEVELTPVEKCEPKPGCVSPAVVANADDGSHTWVAVHTPTPEGVKLCVRVLREGKPEGDERVFSIPAGLAGNAVVVGEHFVFPLANKFLYRLGPKDSEPTQGPAWGGPKVKPNAVCHLTATPDGQLLFGDGDTQLFRRKWTADKPEADKTGGPWELATAMTSPPVAITADGREWVIAADGRGVAVFDPTKPTTDPVRRWRGTADSDLPAGRATWLVRASDRVCWAAGGQAVAIASPTNDTPVVFKLRLDAGEVAGIVALTDGFLVTSSAGVVFELSLTGEVRETTALPVGGPLVTRPSAKIAARDVLIPSSDGTMSRLTMQKR
jgi:outer membrane protein assembly factor BamB